MAKGEGHPSDDWLRDGSIIAADACAATGKGEASA